MLALPPAIHANPGPRSNPARPVRLAAAWEEEAGYYVGLLSIDTQQRDPAFRVANALSVPTRAHGIWAESSATLLTVARRPGDWLLRWTVNGRALRWHWIEPQRVFNGHVIASPDGRTLYTTETDLETGAGLIGVRDARTLRKVHEWPTHGIDPHELVWAPNTDGRNASAGLLIANGGIPTQPETGRAKRDLHLMDSSLVRLDARTGRLQGLWRLYDPRLSLRHLAWNGHTLGIALQAEHDEPAAKAAAPIIALFDGSTLRSAPAPQTLSGYGGDIAPVGPHFAVSCPRDHGIAIFAANGSWQGFETLPEACALAPRMQSLWVAGLGGTMLLQGSAAQRIDQRLPGIRLDNHWTVMSTRGGST